MSHWYLNRNSPTNTVKVKSISLTWKNHQNVKTSKCVNMMLSLMTKSPCPLVLGCSIDHKMSQLNQTWAKLNTWTSIFFSLIWFLFFLVSLYHTNACSSVNFSDQVSFNLVEIEWNINRNKPWLTAELLVWLITCLCSPDATMVSDNIVSARLKCLYLGYFSFIFV